MGIRQVPQRRQGRRSLLSASIISLLLATQVFVAVPGALGATNDITLRVRSTEGGPDIATYRWIINVDNTGTTTQRSPADGCSPGSGYPESCQWTSIAGLPSSSPVAAQGDQDDAERRDGTERAP